ncbi:tail fiber protein [Xanthomonas phage NEB7]|nr:tail fiber protein [Xanthomonas phage NEB7]
MQSTGRPTKFLVPFANNDSAKVELPLTTADATRASLRTGFPPLTGQPPEAGGVPPQLEDMNGGLNQMSRGAWWPMLGGRWPYDATFAADAAINGYPQGALLPSADGLGNWVSTAENNTANPDADSTGWVPGAFYGATALTNQTGGTVTLVPAQAGKRRITVSGTLTSNLVIVVPNWIYSWDFINTTSGAFSMVVRTATGAAAVVEQNGERTPVFCDGTNCTLGSPNIAQATRPTQAIRFDQAVGRLLNVQRFTASGTYTPTPGTARIVVEIVGGGGAGGGAQSNNTAASVGCGGGGGAFVKVMLTSVPSSVTVTIGAGGASANAQGGTGGTTSFGAFASAQGGTGGRSLGADNSIPNFGAEGGPGGDTAAAGGGAILLVASAGASGGAATSLGAGAYLTAGMGGPTYFGGTAKTANTTAGASAKANTGCGGSGTTAASGAVTINQGGAGGSGLCLVWEYA